MNSYFRSIGGYLHIRVNGYGSTRFVNICAKHGIKLWDVEKTEEGYAMNISVSGFRKIQDIVRKTKVKVVIVSKHGLPFFFAKAFYHKFFVIGALFCFLWLMLMSNYVWAIEIEGNSSITDDMILEYLAENNIEIGTKRNEIDADNLEKMFRRDFSDITWISIGQNGTALTIDIKERDVALYEEEEYAASSLYASHDGVVTSIIVRRGTACVKAGETVTEGQLLVDGILPVVKTDGTVLGYNLVNADADIIITYAENYYDEINLYSDQKTYTGNETKELYLRFRNKTFSFFLFSPKYEQYDTLQSFHQVELWEYFYLPVWYGFGIQKEYEINRVKTNENVLKEQLYEKLELFLKSLEEKGVQNIQKDVKISISGSMLILSGELNFEDSNLLRKEITASMETELIDGW